jgi:hypothetical protein
MVVDPLFAYIQVHQYMHEFLLHWCLASWNQVYLFFFGRRQQIYSFLLPPYDRMSINKQIEEFLNTSDSKIWDSP